MIARENAGFSSASSLTMRRVRPARASPRDCNGPASPPSMNRPRSFTSRLAFLGNVGANQYEAVAAALDRVAAQSAPFGLTLDRIGAFPHERKPRVVYVGTREQGAPFRKLAQSVRGSYVALGFQFDDDPVAHVTIARVKDPRAPLRSAEFAPIAFEVGALSLFESLFDPKANTSRYEVARVAPLSAV
jgi:2'-5' RNA ligase